MLISKIFSTLYTWFPLILQGTLMTIAVSLCALMIGATVGTLCGIGSCNKLKRAWWSPIISAYVLVVRGTPLYVQALIVYYALPDLMNINLSPLGAAIVTLGCNSVAYVTEIIRCGINAVPTGQWEAAYILGYSSFKTLMKIIMPQAFKNILPALANEVTSLIKESSIFAALGLLEITRVALNIGAKTLDPMSIYLGIALIYLSLTSITSCIAKKWEKKMEFGHDN